jgi:hypothetical protein
MQSGRAIQRGPQSYSIFQDGSSIPQVRELQVTRGQKRPVLVGTRRMSLAYRFTFPGELVWRDALSAAAEMAED